MVMFYGHCESDSMKQIACVSFILNAATSFWTVLLYFQVSYILQIAVVIYLC